MIVAFRSAKVVQHEEKGNATLAERKASLNAQTCHDTLPLSQQRPRNVNDPADSKRHLLKRV